MVQTHTLPEQIDLIRMADHGVHLQGAIRLTRMSRLRESVGDDNGMVCIDWQFSVDEQHRRWLQGSARAELLLTCQRCLQAFAVNVRADTRLQILSAAVNAPEDADTVMVSTAAPLLNLSDLVEDELLLNLPLVPKHPDNACAPVQAPHIAAFSAAAKPNPFAILPGLIKSKTPP